MIDKYYTKNIETVIREMNVNSNTGLSDKQVKEKQTEVGSNQFTIAQKDSLLKRIINQLKDFSTLVLLFATALSFILALHEGSGFIEPFVILAIVILNVILAITQEGKAEKSLESLAELNAPTCLVLRNEIKREIETVELVPGDIIFLESGNIIPADARLISSIALFSDESSLTGESEPIEKNAEVIIDEDSVIGDQVNMVFSGCIITAGNGEAIVTSTGMSTQMGMIAGHLQNTETKKTPLQVRLDKLGRIISWIALAAALILLVVGLKDGTDFNTMIMVAISMAVAAVPETLALIVTLSLSNGVQKMAKQQALIRKLPAVETLGSTSVICSDKTGTLTQNRMKVKKLWHSEDGPLLEHSYHNSDNHDKNLLMMLSLASNATIEIDKQGNKHYIGDPTEVAIIQQLDETGFDKKEAENYYRKVGEIPFSSDRKLMTVILEDLKDGSYLILTKGAVDRLPLKAMLSTEKQNVRSVHSSFAEQALRVIAIASKKIVSLPESFEGLEKDLELMGMIGLIDPPRPEAKEAILRAKNAGIRTVMITGDHATTATAIAKDIGILNSGEKVMTGAQLSQITDEELTGIVRDYSVYARVSPEDKIRIVQAWQNNNQVVAMTGDGVNDAPALKAADVGIAMGQTGTEVAKNTSDMVLVDDNFATIVDAIAEGRNVYENVKKTISFLLVCNFSEIVIMLFAQLVGWGVILTPIMLLLINLLGDGIPGLQLSNEVSDDSIMKNKPINRSASFFTKDVLKLLTRQIIACSAVTLIAYYIGAQMVVSIQFSPSSEIAQTMTFLTVGFTSILHIFNVRSQKSIFKTRLTTNPMLAGSAIVMIIIFALLVLTPLAPIFGMTVIGGWHWVIVICLSLIPSLIHELSITLSNKLQLSSYQECLCMK